MPEDVPSLSLTHARTFSINFPYPLILETRYWRQPAPTPHTHSHHSDDFQNHKSNWLMGMLNQMVFLYSQKIL